MLKKLSLAALIAMGSMSVASATPLTDAIKGVDLGGMIRVRFYNENPDGASSYNRWRTSSDFKFTIPVSEELKLVYKLGVEGNVYGSNVPGKTSVVDPNPGENLVFFKYAKNGFTALVGKIPVATPVTGSGHGEAHGAGAIATYNFGNGFTLAGAFIGAVKATDAVPVGVNNIYAIGGVYANNAFGKVQAWYFNVDNIIDSDIVVSADLNFLKDAGVALHADFATAELAASGTDTQTYFNVSAKYSNDALCAQLGYAATGKDGGTVVLDADAPIVAVIPVGQIYNIANTTDEKAIYGKIGYNVDAKTNVYVSYVTTDNLGDDLTFGAKYKYNKKLGLSAYYSMKTDSAADNNEFRAEAKYSF